MKPQDGAYGHAAVLHDCLFWQEQVPTHGRSLHRSGMHGVFAPLYTGSQRGESEGLTAAR
jgi:hypothetical protein